MPFIIQQKDVSVVLDKRITHVASGVCLDEYLKCKVWYENSSDVEMNIHHEDSKYSQGIQAVDVICNCIFRKYEFGDAELYKLIERKVKNEKKLFF